MFDIIDYECTKLFEIDQKDQEIIEILTKNEKREMVEDEEIKEILEEIHKDMKEKVRLKIEIEFVVLKRLDKMTDLIVIDSFDFC